MKTQIVKYRGQRLGAGLAVTKLSGIITLTPLWHEDSDGLIGESGLATGLDPVTVKVVDGELVATDGSAGETIPAQIGGVTLAWRVRYDLRAGEQPLALPERTFVSLPGETVELADLVPAELVSTPIPTGLHRGPEGPPGPPGEAVPASAGLVAVRNAVAARSHRRVTILSIGDSWAEPMGQTSFDVSLPSALAAEIEPTTSTHFMRPVWSDLVPWRNTAISYSGSPAERLYDTAPFAREWGGTAELTLSTSVRPYDYAELLWWSYAPDGAENYGDGLQWRKAGDSTWTTITNAESWTLAQDGPASARMARVRIDGWPGVVLRPNTGGVGGLTNRMCLLGVMFTSNTPDLGLASVNFAVSGTSSTWWMNHISQATVENASLRGVSLDILHISLTGADALEGTPIGTYQSNLGAIIAHYRTLAGRSIPVIFTTQSMPDISSGVTPATWDQYRAASRTAVEAAGGWWCDIGAELGPMSGLSAPSRQGVRDFGMRIDDIHLSNLGAGVAASRIAAQILNA